MGLARVTWGAVGLLFLGAVLSGCGPDLHSVDDGAYGALVPTTQQWADDASKDIPGGFAALSADGVKAVVMRVAGNTVTFELDGRIAANRVVEDRRKVEDSEGSGLAKARAQVLILGDEPLELGSLKISQPVIWYAGGYSSAALVSIKPWDANERGPASQCGAADKQCLELPAGEAEAGNPVGTFRNMSDPEAVENPVAGIQMTATEIVYTLATGQEIRQSRGGESLIRACALGESAIWSVPAEVGLAFSDPVLVDTHCALPTGNAPSLTVMERPALPLLAPLAPRAGGQWCQAGPGCLWFVNEEGVKG